MYTVLIGHKNRKWCLFSRAVGDKNAINPMPTALLKFSADEFKVAFATEISPPTKKMSNSLQASETTQDQYVEYNLPAGPGVEEGTIGMDFSLPDLDCTDPDFLSFDPFPFHSINDEMFPLSDSVMPPRVIDPSLTKDNHLLECSGELNKLHNQLQKRIDQLDETCKRLENEYG